MHPYTAQENEWLSGRSDSDTPVLPLTKPALVLDDAVIQMHMRRGERMRALEVRRCMVALFRMPATALRAIGGYLKPATPKPNH